MGIIGEFMEDFIDGVRYRAEDFGGDLQLFLSDGMDKLGEVMETTFEMLDSAVAFVDYLIGSDRVDEAKELIRKLEGKGEEEVERFYARYRDEMSEMVRREFEEHMKNSVD